MSPDLYDAAKVMHILSFVAWMAGLFYLPRLFVYHTRLTPDAGAYPMFCEMERKLLLFIMRPAAISTWLFGLLMGYDRFWSFGDWPIWLTIKIGFVIGMTMFHVACHGHASAFVSGAPERPERYYRFFNEIPTLLLIPIVVLVIFQFQ